jgi:trk system potassium uptake protein TrkH
MINFNPISNVLGILLMLLGALMFTGLPFSWYFDSGDAQALFFSGSITILVGLLLRFIRFRSAPEVNKREGYLIVALGWFAMCLFGTLPFFFSGAINSPVDLFFESVSGLTTTGASVLNDIEAVPQGILYWRSMTQWLGGMGIIVLTVAIFPLLGIGGIELFVAESSGPTSDKLHPRIRDTARRLWLVYVGLTAVLVPLLWLSGMTFFDAVNHAYTTMSTGGFSTRNASMAAFPSPLIQYIVIFFMFLSAVNYGLIYWTLKGQVHKLWKSEEFRFYLFMVLALTLLITAVVATRNQHGLEQAFRDSLFQVVSIVTTTGFVSADYTSWGAAMIMLFFILFFTGAMAGSTSGGIKLIRHLVFLKNSLLEFKRILHPNAVIPLKLNGQVVKPKIMTHILVFLLVYLFLFVFGSIFLSMQGIDFVTAAGASATSLGNVGPGIGQVGPVDNFAWLPDASKLLLAFFMLLGRLELFTILVLFTPYFWKR